MPLALLLAALLAQPPASREALEARFQTIAASAGGTVGVSVLHLESGQGAALHGNERFPMASVFKLAVAIELSARADRGAVRLDQTIAIAQSDLRLGRSPIAEKAPKGGITLSVGELLEAMLVDSDNTAADLLLPLAGGPEVITAQLDAAGLGDIRVDRPEVELAFDSAGVTEPPPRATWSLATLRQAFAAVPEPARHAAFVRFLADPRDTATPNALVQLLRQLAEGRRLTSESRDRILALMARTRSGEHRLKGDLPAGTPVAHRTGSGADDGKANICTNDVGIVTLPGGRGRLAIAVMIKGSDREPAAREKAIAEIARAAVDYWMR
ncbi:MAG TPA: class A beta-lactamase [Thermoanaerobaculia bacterium]|nr:class A beta-lactamase [Thermoanaerobaculia bacterium]